MRPILQTSPNCVRRATQSIHGWPWYLRCSTGRARQL